MKALEWCTKIIQSNTQRINPNTLPLKLHIILPYNFLHQTFILRIFILWPLEPMMVLSNLGFILLSY